MDSGEIFSKKSKKTSKKKSSVVLIVWVTMILLVASLSSWLFLELEQSNQSSVNTNASNNGLAITLKEVEVAQQYSMLLKSLSVNLDSEVVSVDTPISVERNEQGFVVSNRIQLAFYNHSELYVQVSDIAARVDKQSDHTYSVDVSVSSGEINSVVVPPLGKVITDVFFTTKSECVLKSFAVTWQYDYAIDNASLDFIFQGNEKLREQAELATKNKGLASQIVINHSDLKSIQEQTEDFCQYEI